jgi:hypothetical protein
MDKVEQNADEPTRRRCRLRYGLRTLLVLMLLACIAGSYWAWERSHRVFLPARQEIAFIKVGHKFWDFEGDRTIPAFQIPEKHWDAVLAGLAPCKRDRSPKTWLCLCVLDVGTTSNRNYVVDVFWLGYEDPGAFKVSVDEQFTYYRGGNSSEVRAAIIAAYDESKSLAP